MKRQLFLPFILMGLLVLSTCQTAVNELEAGVWRGVFQTDSAIDIPFNFEIYDSAGAKQIAFINGKERLNINAIELKDDSVIIKTPMYETEIHAKLSATGLTGTWIRNLPDRIQTMPFHASPSLFVGRIVDDSIVGDMYSGPGNHSKWEAKADENAKLDNAYSMTRLKPEYNTLSFQFPDTEGEMVSLTDERFKNKVVVIQFLGSWCPNCMDETAFLSPFYKEYNNRGLEIVGLAYERYSEPARAKVAVKNLMDRFDVTYPVLLTGYSNKSGQVLESLPALENFNAFPTTIIIDKKGSVHTIHSGFDGPATGNAYRTYIKNFESTINQLLNE